MINSKHPLFAMLKDKMAWHQQRQKLLAQNVANADTPGYKPHDLKEPDFHKAMRLQGSMRITTERTHANHLAGDPVTEDTNGFKKFEKDGWEVTPSGNSVILEQEMMKVTQNQMDYQAATTLYTRALQLIKVSIGDA